MRYVACLLLLVFMARLNTAWSIELLFQAGISPTAVVLSPVIMQPRANAPKAPSEASKKANPKANPNAPGQQTNPPTPPKRPVTPPSTTTPALYYYVMPSGQRHGCSRDEIERGECRRRRLSR